MSTPSKKRRKARAWMQHRIKEECDRVLDLNTRHLKRLKEVEDQARRRVNEVSEELTLRIAPADDRTVFPQGQLQHTRVVVAPHFDGPIVEGYRDFYDRCAHDPRFLPYTQEKRFTLQATQHALVLPDGTKVVWYGWEHAR